MNIRFLLSVIAATVFVGCVTPIGKTSFPEAQAGFTPKQTYLVNYDTLWNSVIAALDKNRVAMTSTDKASGIIQTDYTQGTSSLIGGGFIASQSTRYKYNLTIRKQSDTENRLNVLAKVESTMKGHSGASPWTDVSGQNEALVKQLENWLYEQVEKELGGK